MAGWDAKPTRRKPHAVAGLPLGCRRSRDSRRESLAETGILSWEEEAVRREATGTASELRQEGSCLLVTGSAFSRSQQPRRPVPPHVSLLHAKGPGTLPK